jgi:hypothetical protein
MIALTPGGESAAEKITQQLSKALTDLVPNVRFVGVKALRQIGQRFDALRDSIRKMVASLSDDPDKDVKFYASEV